MFEIFGTKPNIDFIGKRKYSFILSSLLVLLGLAAFISIMLGKANMGIDFTGGTMVQGSFDKPIAIGELRSALIDNGFPEANIQSLSTEGVLNSYLIRVKTVSEGLAPGQEYVTSGAFLLKSELKKPTAEE